MRGKHVPRVFMATLEFIGILNATILTGRAAALLRRALNAVVADA